jgi:hypothetical protein
MTHNYKLSNAGYHKNEFNTLVDSHESNRHRELSSCNEYLNNK